MILKQSWQFVNLFSLPYAESWSYKKCLSICPLWNYSDFWQVAQDTETGKLTCTSCSPNTFHAKINLDILHGGKSRAEILPLQGFTTIISFTTEFTKLKASASSSQSSGRTVCSAFIQMLDPPALHPSALEELLNQHWFHQSLLDHLISYYKILIAKKPPKIQPGFLHSVIPLTHRYLWDHFWRYCQFSWQSKLLKMRGQRRSTR